MVAANGTPPASQLARACTVTDVPPSRITRGIARGSERIPALRGLPVLRLLAVAEVLLLARQHVARLEPHERRRLVELVRIGRGRRRHLTPQQREELAALIEKAAPRQFVAEAVSRLSPVPLPQRLLRGRRPRS
jgi:hypothetical protein